MIQRLYLERSFSFSLVFLLAFCSVAYELVLGQMLAALNGNTIAQYSTVIGIYIANLGFGSLFVGFLKEEYAAKRLFSVEMALSFLGGFSPFILLFIKSFHLDSSIPLYFMICIIGFLSGMEIPLLSSWFKESGRQKSNGFVLGADYFGTVLGCVIFPFFLLPKLGLFTTALFLGGLNLCISSYMFYKLEKLKMRYLCTISLVWIALILTFYYLNEISDFMVGKAFA